MRILSAALLSLLIPVAAFSQAGNGTITGTINRFLGARSPARRWKLRIPTREWCSQPYPRVPAPIPSTSLQPGPYSVSVSARWFKEVHRVRSRSRRPPRRRESNVPLEVAPIPRSITFSAAFAAKKTRAAIGPPTSLWSSFRILPVLGMGASRQVPAVRSIREVMCRRSSYNANFSP